MFGHLNFHLLKMYHHWGCTLIYRPLSYPLRFIIKTQKSLHILLKTIDFVSMVINISRKSKSLFLGKKLFLIKTKSFSIRIKI